MAAKVGLSIAVQGDDIVVTLPGTSSVVAYYRAAAFPRAAVPPLINLYPFVIDPAPEIERHDGLARHVIGGGVTLIYVLVLHSSAR